MMGRRESCGWQPGDGRTLLWQPPSSWQASPRDRRRTWTRPQAADANYGHISARSLTKRHDNRTQNTRRIQRTTRRQFNSSLLPPAARVPSVCHSECSIPALLHQLDVLAPMQKLLLRSLNGSRSLNVSALFLVAVAGYRGESEMTGNSDACTLYIESLLYHKIQSWLPPALDI